MENMPDCRFRHTLNCISDCYDALLDDGLESLSEEERLAALKVIRLCRDIAGDYEHELDEEEQESGR